MKAYTHFSVPSASNGCIHNKAAEIDEMAFVQPLHFLRERLAYREACKVQATEHSLLIHAQIYNISCITLNCR